MDPLVTVIALCYNHERFVLEALDSVWRQTYTRIQLIIVDDQSQDQSVARIRQWIATQEEDPHRSIQFIPHQENQGVCVSFNEALAHAKGDYVIDFATDDVMLNTRLEDQVRLFESLSDDYGIVYSNAILIDEKGKQLRTHYTVDDQGKTIETLPQGDIYKEILTQYFISTPTMMTRKEVYERLNGYDASLSYEDFDFWIRSSRLFGYAYLDKVTTLRRVVKDSLSTKFYTPQNNLLKDTLHICRKAYKLNQNKEEDKALATCVQYHLRQSFYMQDHKLVQDYYKLLSQPKLTSYITTTTKVIRLLARLRLPVYPLYRWYLRSKARN